MKIKKAIKKIDVTLIILISLVLLAMAIAFWQGGWQTTKLGLIQAGNTMETVWFRLLLGFTLGGLIQVLVPRGIIARWLGPKSGLKGILIGSYIGGIMGGAPYVMLPVVASLYAAGAGAGPTIALVTGQSLLSLQTILVWQIPFLGVGLPLSKYIVCLFLTPLIALAGSVVFKLLGKLPDSVASSCRNVPVAGQLDGAEKTSEVTNREEKL